MDSTIHELHNNEVAIALELAWEVFMEFEAPDYSQEGVNEFRYFLDNQDGIQKLRFFGALSQNKIVGILAARQNHISLLFVRKEFHRQGIARRLFRYMLSQTKSDGITVNSSPYALEIYGKLGFIVTNSEQITNGIQYTPMIYKTFSLRPLMPDDAESIASELNNKKVWDNLRDGLPFPYTIEDAKAFIELQNNEPSLTCYGIVVDGKAVGNIGFTRNHDVERFSAEVGYYIGEDYWNKGIMSAALASAVDDYFSTTDVIRLYATPFEHNEASARVLEKAGFIFKCTMTKAVFKNGQFTDELYFERIKG